MRHGRFRTRATALPLALSAAAFAAPGAGAATIQADCAPFCFPDVTYTAAAGHVNVVTISGPTGGPIRITRNPAAGDDDAISGAIPATCFAITPGVDYQCSGSTAAARGGDLGDTLTSTRSGTTYTELSGEAGADVLTGAAGNDSLSGGDGFDQLIGGGGNDSLGPGAGNDLSDGGDGNDTFSLSDGGTDTAKGGAGDDSFVVPAGTVDMQGGLGIDAVVVIAQDPAATTALDMSFTLDDQANDGAAGSGSNARSDIEDVLGAYTLLGGVGGDPGDIDEGKLTIVGTAGPNTLMGDTSDDSVEGGAGNDSLSGGRGADTLRARDGFADRVNCGADADTAVVDTLDVVSDNCEVVQSADIGNANDVPEDRPPTVAITAPAAGATLGTGATVLSATAADDRGIARVQFLDDDRILCTDATAPYTCDYQPRGEDVGRNTLVVMAVDTAEQSATAVRTATVPRFGATLSLQLTPRRDVRAPHRFTSAGRLTLPPTVSPALGCAGGRVSVQFKAGRKTVSSRSVALRSDCTFRSRVSFRLPGRLRPPSLRVQATYTGNTVLTPTRSRRQTVKVR